jgi:uncharacterized membrane protein YbhN (UPF0104 family)
MFGYRNGALLSEWSQIILICIVIYSAVAFVPTPGNSGAADLTFYSLFAASLTVTGMAFSAMIVWRLLCFYSFIFAGIFMLILRKIIKKRTIS